MRSTPRLLIPALALAIAGGAAQAQQSLTPNQQLARDIYQELIETNSSTMTAGTTEAAQKMARRFRDAGFPEKDIFLGGVRPDKFNVVLRYHGKGGPHGPKPLLLLAHLDVVEALKTDWSPDLDPFKLTERDGYFYGRGTSDDKAQAAIWVANIIQLKKQGYVPDRDIIVALTADEEGGCCNGARWHVANHRDLVDAAIVKAIADTAIEVSEAPNRPPMEPSPLLPEVMGPIETITKEMWGTIPVIPTMMTGATDAIPWRALGIPSYGVSGVMIDPADLRAHGRDERIFVKSFYDGQEFMYRLTKALSSARVVP